MPRPYLRTFVRLAPAFAAGAPLRAQQLGDSGASSPASWAPGFDLHAAHVLITLHGPAQPVRDLAEALRLCWSNGGALECVDQQLGARLAAPPGESGEWVHFGYRDVITDHRVEGVAPLPHALPIEREHAAGEFVLGHANDDDYNVFALPTAPAKVREFFHDGSFAAYRPLQQDVAAFEAFVQRQAVQAPPEVHSGRDWVKAKLCGRWPGGQALRPDQLAPWVDDFDLDFAGDGKGTGCPFASHARRMRALASDAHRRERPLLRRSIPFGPAIWAEPPAANEDADRGLLGLFFCASLEDQFEHLLGQWANRRPLGSPDRSRAKDPLIGSHEDAQAEMILPGAGGRAIVLTGLQPWTRTLGTLYAWCPSRSALDRLLAQDYAPVEDQGPWL